MTNSSAKPTGRLRIDVGSSAATRILLPALGDFCDRYPDIQIDLGVSDRAVDLITDNVDCVIRGGELTDQSLVARRIGHLGFVTVASPAYVARHGRPLHPAEIDERHQIVSYFIGNSRRVAPLEFRKGDEVIEHSAPSRLSLNDSSAHLAAVIGGFGLAQTVRYMAEPHLRSGELVELLPDWTRPALPVHVVYPPNRHLSAKVRAFVDWAADLFAGNPSLQKPVAVAAGVERRELQPA